MDQVFDGVSSVLKAGQGLKTPCYVIDEKKLERNAEVLASVISHTGCRILLAQKAFSNYDFYPLISGYISGTEASGLFEAKLGKEEMPEGEVHVFSAAYRDDEISEIISCADHIVFNSIYQLKKFGPAAKKAGRSLGLRINPECSTQEGHEIYDPCASGSRLGVTRGIWDREMTPEAIALLDGIHFHTLCEQGSDALEITLRAVEEKFGDILPQMKWLNMGGGHHITKAGYDVAKLEELLIYARDKWDVQVYLEPGEAVALNAGYLLTRVLDIVENNGIKIAILDASAACHMPDVIEMPYTPPLLNAASDNSKKYCYRLAGPTCLSGDVIGQYGFDAELKTGDLLVFGDMAIYTTCKNNTFNGMPLPDIYRLKEDGRAERLTDFGYSDFKRRLGSS
ncbi:carboxynorspermidine decarboxylase [Butyrivibrio sp. AE2032]|uniref:carboxynorspermidine decarboxylase n=1 Tax=Butyrivibrio sp. AE2032 TaxID=1458463 RepID=UPI00054F2DAF|nr:carboxynorspermidine decarboxylase [Butyrivibrio sp. AE2032]